MTPHHGRPLTERTIDLRNQLLGSNIPNHPSSRFTQKTRPQITSGSKRKLNFLPS
jgi:hypothetical protein